MEETCMDDADPSPAEELEQMAGEGEIQAAADAAAEGESLTELEVLEGVARPDEPAERPEEAAQRSTVDPAA